MDPSRRSTHYFITMTTFAHHSLAETWNFVASITETQVFTCATNFKLYVKSTVRKKRNRSISPSACTATGSCVGTKFAILPSLQPSVPSMQGEAHLLCLVLATVLQSPSGFSDRRQKKRSKKKTKKQRTDCKSLWFDIASEIIKKPIFLTLQTQFLSLKCYYVYLWMCFICAHFVRMAAELCRMQENSSLIKLI